MGDRLAEQLFRRHIGRSAGILLVLGGLFRNRLRQIKVHQSHPGVARDQHVFRFEVQVHVAALVHMLQPQRHID